MKTKTLKIHQIKHNTFIALVLFLVKKFGRNKHHLYVFNVLLSSSKITYINIVNATFTLNMNRYYILLDKILIEQELFLI